ncbi:MAG: hypothetical protein M1431_05815 [Candidatus Thermoplasmatota archaeon]|nr:hypothetical protein [Candidatus Thermoplasmatota archaeon]
MKRNILSIIVIAVALMVPAVATASVVISDPISVGVSDTGSNHVFIAEGPGYGIANGLGYITIHGNNSKTSNVSVNLSSVPGNGYLELFNVLEINNTLKSGDFANVTLTTSMPAGTFLYYNNTSQSKLVDGSISGVNVTASNTVTFELKYGSSPVYLSFLVMGNSVGDGSITFSYTIS